jgi:hypothetical protein
MSSQSILKHLRIFFFLFAPLWKLAGKLKERNIIIIIIIIVIIIIIIIIIIITTTTLPLRD